MRDFGRTPEPAGMAGTAPAASVTTATGTPDDTHPRFVVQRHRARRLHYDLRLEMGGVLASWAVPKGPTLDPAVRRMAVHVEDHPLEYVAFEGVIPAGQYGGGDVIVWDEGTWELHGADDPLAAVAAGEVHAELTGHKLRGRFVLVRRSGGAAAGQDGQDQWVLLHKRDAHAVDGWDPEEHPRSVLSGRTNDEVKADPDALWRSGLPADRAEVRLRPRRVTDNELAALAALGAAGTWDVFGRSLRLTNLDKPLFPPRDGGPALTKRDLVRYAARIAPVAVPYLSGRALNMHRFPDGAGRAGFWHKQLPAHAPEWVTRWVNPDADPGETTTYAVVDEPATLVWAANFGALEWHAWTSRTDAPHLPTYVLLDVDPGPRTSWDDVALLVRLHRDALAHLGVHGYPKLTGRRGVQIWVPIARGPTFAETRAWAEQLSKAIGAVVPELVSWRWGVDERAGLARLDYTQNAVNKTLVAPYSPRAAPGAPVSAPVEWDELDDPDLRSDRFTVSSVLDRLAARPDPFRALLTDEQALPSIG
jgi:bifunctional non-homologous end joining protein LigD